MSKIDKQLESGEYFMTDKIKKKQKVEEREARHMEKDQARAEKRKAAFKPPEEESRIKKAKTSNVNEDVDLKKLKKKVKKT